jgi:dipeptidase E
MYLSSFRLGNCPKRLVSLARHGTWVVVIANAMDAAPPDVREAGVQREVLALTGLGFTVDELDLRSYFLDASPLGADLRRYDVVWLRGGNAFMLRYALARSSADAELGRLLQEDAFVYSGYSAGPCVLAPSLRGP